jgi:acetyl esterase/lipase
VPLKRLAAALSPLTLINGLAAGASAEVTKDISFGPQERHKLDVYRPRSGRNHPVAVFFYGGGWEEGARDDYRFVGAALAEAGIVAVIPDYRLYPEVRFDGFLEDGARAVRWANDHVAAFGGDPSRLVLIGHSAGGHIAGMLALDTRWLDGAGLARGTVRGWVGLAGPYDFKPDTPNRLAILGPDRAVSQPIGYVRADAPPALLGSGKRDAVVDPGNATRLARRYTEVGGWAEVTVYPRVDHASILGAFSPLLRFLGPVFKDTVGFVERVTAGRSRRSEAA